MPLIRTRWFSVAAVTVITELAAETAEGPPSVPERRCLESGRGQAALGGPLGPAGRRHRLSAATTPCLRGHGTFSSCLLKILSLDIGTT